jgi:hypothetical protein
MRICIKQLEKAQKQLNDFKEDKNKHLNEIKKGINNS